ncbi:MAG: polysaccharide biosynthesis/export family protein [Algiphilus sp.]|uniref:polysaccharide biosynthesis/export family protein n=1 Tax=Algiphilus sp. TaxID=1872431 RepID=UPI0032EE2930
MKRIIGLAVTQSVAALLLSGCTILPGLNVNPASDADQRQASLPYTLLQITPSVIAELEERAAERARLPLEGGLQPVEQVRSQGYDYRVGPGDVLNVVVWEHPELTNPGNELRDTQSAGRLVGPDGVMFYPYVGSFQAAGMTLAEIRNFIAENLQRVIRTPQVDVRILEYRSQRVFVTGEVQQPGVSVIDDTPRGILDLINEHGGLTELASQRIAVLSRNQESHLVNLHALHARGNTQFNVAVQAGDVLHIPDNSADKVFVLGEVGQQGSVAIDRHYMSLTEAIAGAEGMDVLSADDASVFVFRSGVQPGVSRLCDCEPEDALVFGLDLSRADGILLAERFELQPRDVVYVSSTDFARYNRIVNQILPTVSTLFQLDRLITD